MKALRLLAITALLAAAISPAASAEVHLSLAQGRVTLSARDATVRQILAEWARVGQVKIVNAERIPGGPLTIELKDVPEEQALDLLLRAVSGYMAAPRTSPVPNASRFDRVVVLATAAAARAPVAAAPVAAQQPVFTAPQPVPDDPADDQEQPANAVPSINPRGPIFNTFPQPQVVNPQQGATTATPGTTVETPEPQDNPPSQTPSSFPGAVSAPGMIAAPPEQPRPADRRR